jgi:hypothetical protein
MRTIHLVRAAALAALALTSPSPAHAAAPPDCSTLNLPNPIYMQIGDTQQPLIKELGRALRDSAVKPTTLIYITSDSCSNIAAARIGAPISITMSYVPSTLENGTWKTTDPPLSCSPPGGSVVPDILNSNVFISACETTPLPDTIAIDYGAAQAYVLAVPKASHQTVITAEEAYFVFGFGAAGMAMPWTSIGEIYVRNVTASTLLAWAANVGIQPPIKMKGQPLAKSADVVSALKKATDPEAAIGILGAEVYAANTTTLTALAYRAYGQYHAYWPDSTSSGVDKQNVRDGHYTVWSPTVYMYKLMPGTTTPVKPDAKWVVDLIANRAATPAPEFDPVQFVFDVGLVPLCAMKVTRAFEGGDLSPYDPPEPCGCFFDHLAGKSPACSTCDVDHPCASGTTCRHGYCEAR